MNPGEGWTGPGGWGDAPPEQLGAATGAENRLRMWWEHKAIDDINAVVPKAIDYGGADLTIMADGMRHLLPEGAPRSVQRQAAIAFYVLGKVARIISAVSEGREPNPDSWYDTMVYAQMARFEIEIGPWPTGQLELFERED